MQMLGDDTVPAFSCKLMEDFLSFFLSFCRGSSSTCPSVWILVHSPGLEMFELLSETRMRSLTDACAECRMRMQNADADADADVDRCMRVIRSHEKMRNCCHRELALSSKRLEIDGMPACHFDPWFLFTRPLSDRSELELGAIALDMDLDL
jgi:hypothetical protein